MYDLRKRVAVVMNCEDWGRIVDLLEEHGQTQSEELIRESIECAIVQPKAPSIDGPQRVAIAILDGNAERLPAATELQPLGQTDSGAMMDRAPEVWPFHDECSGALIKEDRFYGFGDAGGLYGSFDGYATAQEAVDVITRDMEGLAPSTDPADLGGAYCTVMTGRQYVDKLYELDDLSAYGHWSKP